MTLPRIFLIVFIVLFGSIGMAKFYKQPKNQASQQIVNRGSEDIEQIPVASANSLGSIQIKSPLSESNDLQHLASIQPSQEVMSERKDSVAKAVRQPLEETGEEHFLPEVDRIDLLFQKDSPLSFIQTVQYKSRVSWKKGRPAWLVDYAGHYKTSRHFIARSLNGRPEYFLQNISEGDRFNVFSLDKNLEFWLVIDARHCQMALYACDLDNNERVHLKTYRVGLGRPDPSRTSGMLTPFGTFSLGSRVAIFQPKMMGSHRGKRVEMVQVFGTRWIPFEKEVEGCTEPAKGFGIHGAPWHPDPKTGQLVQDVDSIGKFESDGCIRMSKEDVEELYAIIITKPTYVQILKDVSQASLPGVDKEY